MALFTPKRKMEHPPSNWLTMLLGLLSHASPHCPMPRRPPPMWIHTWIYLLACSLSLSLSSFLFFISRSCKWRQPHVDTWQWLGNGNCEPVPEEPPFLRATRKPVRMPSRSESSSRAAAERWRCWLCITGTSSWSTWGCLRTITLLPILPVLVNFLPF